MLASERADLLGQRPVDRFVPAPLDADPLRFAPPPSRPVASLKRPTMAAVLGARVVPCGAYTPRRHPRQQRCAASPRPLPPWRYQPSHLCLPKQTERTCIQLHELDLVTIPARPLVPQHSSAPPTLQPADSLGHVLVSVNTLRTESLARGHLRGVIPLTVILCRIPFPGGAARSPSWASAPTYTLQS